MSWTYYRCISDGNEPTGTLVDDLVSSSGVHVSEERGPAQDQWLTLVIISPLGARPLHISGHVQKNAYSSKCDVRKQCSTSMSTCTV